MFDRIDRKRPWWSRGATPLKGLILGLLALALVVPMAGLSQSAKSTKGDAACQLQVFSWWTGGGEAAGLTKLIKIWNAAN